ncbi:hypothetical protein FIU94_04810 [Sulfitobacter sp. THAF37]|nr:hypothetical protein [Sulfitobacter sp. THAF37]QFT58136.1 hypothetical protein FIU94_04810 [Sulfitobacter sp. THAF37]
MNADLFLGGLAVLTLAAIVIVAMTSGGSKSRSFEEKQDRNGTANR